MSPKLELLLFEKALHGDNRCELQEEKDVLFKPLSLMVLSRSVYPKIRASTAWKKEPHGDNRCELQEEKDVLFKPLSLMVLSCNVYPKIRALTAWKRNCIRITGVSCLR